MISFENSLAFAKKLDKADSLKKFRQQFFIPKHKGKDCIYFTGNSLGLQPKATQKYIAQELADWAKLGVEGHFHARNPWMPYHEQFAKPLAALVGARLHEVVAMNQLTVNLHLLMASFYNPTKERFKILCEAKAFPSDQYALQSQVKFHGYDPKEAIIEMAPLPGEDILNEEAICNAIRENKDSVCLVFMGGVNYYSGQVFDMKKITAVAHEVGAHAGFDLAHAAGNIKLNLHQWKVDFACWCSYKYLNSGPGGVAGVFIHEKHAKNKSLLRFAGWWGSNKKTRFAMPDDFDPIPTAEGWQLSNAPVLSMAAHKAALDIFMKAGLENIFEKGKLLADYMHFLLGSISQKNAVLKIITPSQTGQHGCQVSLLMLRQGKKIFKQLQENGVVADWREPNVIRVAPVPLYNSFEEVFHFCKMIETLSK